MNINSLKKNIIEIINSNNIKQNLFKNFFETLEKYYAFIKYNELLDLEE